MNRLAQLLTEIVALAPQAERVTSSQAIWAAWTSSNTAMSAIEGLDVAAVDADRWASACHQLNVMKLPTKQVDQPHQFGLVVSSARFWLLAPPGSRDGYVAPPGFDVTPRADQNLVSLTRAAGTVYDGAKLRIGLQGQVRKCSVCASGSIQPGEVRCGHCGAALKLDGLRVCDDCIEIREGKFRGGKCDRCRKRAERGAPKLGPPGLRERITQCEHLSQITRDGGATSECRSCGAKVVGAEANA